VDRLGRTTTYAYDGAGNLTQRTDPLGQIRAITYDPTFNKVTSITDPLGNLTTFEYNAQGNLLAITDPEQNKKPEAQRLKTRFTYNSFGQPRTTTDVLGNMTTFEYDNLGNLVSITDPLGNSTQRSYDIVSRLLAQTDPRGQTTRFSYDNLNRLPQIVDALNGLTTFGYDPNGNLLTVTDARGNTITHEYDTMDRLGRRIDQLGAAETFNYDGNGNLVSTTDRKGQTSTFSYDALNRRTQATYADGAVATYSYDAAGRLLQADDTADPHRAITLTYDALDRLLSETTLLGTVSYQYDASGRRRQMTVGGEAPVEYTYDANSRLRTIAQSSFLSPVTIDYDALGRRTLLSLPNGVSTEYVYDLGSRLTALIYRNALGPLGDLTYQYDQSGNRIGVGGSFARTLLPDSVPSATYDAANRQLAFGDRTMTFDPNGNLATLTEAAGISALTWDTRNRLVVLSGPGLSGSFAYDAADRRARKAINEQGVIFEYSGDDIVREETGDRTLTYLRGLDLDEVLIRFETQGPVSYLADALGNTVSLTEPTGTLRTTYAYTPFGESVASGLPSTNPFQYTGRESDGTGLLYYRARYYHPALGRFVSEDPIGLSGGDVNLYTYAVNNPTNFSDPLGLVVAYALSPIRFEAADSALDYWASRTVDPNASVASQYAAYFFGLSAALVAGKNAETTITVLSTAASVSAPRPVLGRNPRIGGSRVNTDLPGGRAAGKSIFRKLTEGQPIITDRGRDGSIIRYNPDRSVQIRMKPDGTTSLDVVGRGPVGRETIHFR
jgi:RHS repeat-associated protein